MNDKIIKQGIGYDAIRHLTNGIIAVRLGYKWGLVDDNNNELMPIIYDYISYEDRQLWARFKGYKFYIPIEWLPLKYDCIYDFGEKGCAKVEKNGKYGVVDNQYKELIPCRYDDLDFRKKEIHAKRKTYNNTNYEITYDIFSRDGSLLLGDVYFPITYGIIIGKKKDGNLKYGLIDENYNFIIPCENKSIQQIDFSYHQYYGYYDVLQEGGYHFLWMGGKGLINIGYDEIEKPGSRLRGLLFCRRKQLFPTYEEHANKIQRNISLEKINYSCFVDYYDVYSKDKQLLSYCSAEVELVSLIEDDLFICKNNFWGKYGLICKEGYRAPFIYDELYYDERLKTIIAIRDAEYEETEDCTSFNNNTNGFNVKTSKTLKYGIVDFYNSKGLIIKQGIDLGLFDSKLSGLCAGYLRLHIYDSLAVFKDSKEIIREDSFDEVGSFVKFGGLYGEYIDLGYAIVKNNGKVGAVNSEGQLLIPFEYDQIELLKSKQYWREQQSSILCARTEDAIAFYKADKGLEKLDYSYILTEMTADNLLIVSKEKIPMKYKTLDDLKTYEICGEGKGFSITKVVDGNIGEARFEHHAHQHLFGKIDSFGNEVFPCDYTIEEIQKKVLPKHHKKEHITLNKYYGFKTVKDSDTGKVGIMGDDDNFILECAYSSISVDYDLGLVIPSIRVTDETGMSGIVDRKGQLLLPIKYHFDTRSWERENSLYYIVNAGDKYGIVNHQGVFIVPCVFPQLSFEYKLMKQGLVLVTEKEKKGLIDLNNNNNYVLNCTYDSIDVLSPFYEDTNEFLIAKKGNLYTILSLPDFALVSEARVIDLIEFVLVKDNTIVVKTKENDNIKYRMISISKKIASGDIEYDGIGSFGEHYIQVQKNNKWGLFNTMTCEEEIPCEYDERENNFMFNSDEGYAVVKKDGLYGFVDHNNQIVIACSFCYAEPFSEETAIVKTSGKTGCHYQSRYYRYPSRTEQIEDGTWGLVNLRGELIADGYEDIKEFNDGLAAAKKNGKWGYIDKKGKVVIPFRFVKAKSFSDGLAAVAFKIRYGYIDRHNNTIIPFKYIEAGDFQEGTASVETSNNGYGEISKDGLVIEWETPSNNGRDDYDYERDTWDAMTDGQYGDMPDGFDGDYDFLGY